VQGLNFINSISKHQNIDKMKTKLFLFVVMGVFSWQIMPSQAQLTSPALDIIDFVALDSTRFIVKYSLDFIGNPEKPETPDHDVLILEIGREISKSYSYGLFKYDSIRTACKNCDAVPGIRVPVPTIEVFKNHPQGKNSVVQRTPLNKPVFLYEDEVNFQWTILPDRKQIAGYMCQKATTTFRGREWEAWFAQQIPVSDGPWKFNGLPGLILQVSDNRNHFVFTCIDLSREKVAIKKWKWRYGNTTREKANNYMKNYAERPAYVLQQNGIKFRIINKSEAEAFDFSFPYNPLELE
jgi:GLPGLI family protein